VVSVRPAGRNVVVRTRNARVLLLDDLGGTALGGRDPGRRLGPYLIDSLSDESADLRAFEHYFKGRAAIDQVQLRSFHSQRSAWAALMRGEIDALHEISRVAAEFAEQGERVRTYPVLRPYVAGIAFNVRRGPFRDPEVRQALSLAVDRAAIVRMAYRGRARAADGPLWPGHWTLARDPVAAYDPRAAAGRLARLPLRPASGTGMSARLAFRCLTIPGLETQPFERIALLLQRQFYDLGVDMQFEPVTVPEFFRRVASGDFDAVLNEFLGFTPTWVSRIWRSPVPGGNPLMDTGYTAADAALDAMQLATTEDELRRAVAAVYRRMSDHPPAIFIAWPEVARAVTTDFDVPLERGTDIMGANLWFWRPAGAARRASGP
jgi:ABC-type transport system substrate-binding protein